MKENGETTEFRQFELLLEISNFVRHSRTSLLTSSVNRASSIGSSRSLTHTHRWRISFLCLLLRPSSTRSSLVPPPFPQTPTLCTIRANELHFTHITSRGMNADSARQTIFLMIEYLLCNPQTTPSVRASFKASKLSSSSVPVIMMFCTP